MFFLWVLPWLNNSWCSYDSSKMEREMIENEMTANEMADVLEDWVSPRTVKQAATMLRQQQAEIEQLKALAISLSHRNANLIYTKSEK